MGRPTRIQFPGACYYITLRGNNRQNLFLSNQDRRFFLALLKSYKERHDLKVYAYCLMDQEIQMVIETAHADLSRVMQGLNTAYTKYFNKAHDMTGHVFQGRYGALLIDKDNYLLEMTRRVHLTPVRAGLREKPWRYLWSSCAAYVESEARDPLVDSSSILRQFAKNRLKQSVQYLHYIKARAKSAEKISFPVHGICVGKPEFAAAMRQASQAPDAGSSTSRPASEFRRFGTDVSPAEEKAAARQRARQILAEALTPRISEEMLLGRGRWGEVANVRRTAIYRIWKEAKLGVTDISRMFHRTPSAVSQLLQAYLKT